MCIRDRYRADGLNLAYSCRAARAQLDRSAASSASFRNIPRQNPAHYEVVPLGVGNPDGRRRQASSMRAWLRSCGLGQRLFSSPAALVAAQAGRPSSTPAGQLACPSVCRRRTLPVLPRCVGAYPRREPDRVPDPALALRPPEDENPHLWNAQAGRAVSYTHLPTAISEHPPAPVNTS